MELYKDLIKTQNEQEAEKQIFIEFKDLTNNQVYDHVYRKRLLSLKRGISIATKPQDFFGFDSREVMIPSLKSTLNSILNNKKERTEFSEAAAGDSTEFHMLDVGAGSGEPFDWFFAEEFSSMQKKRKNYIYGIETNPQFIELYKERVEKYQDLFELRMIYNGRIQDYYDGNPHQLPLPSKPLDFVNCMHMIYHLTDYTAPHFDPYNDIKEFVKFLYGILKPGGSIYIVYIDPSKSFAPINSLFYKEIVKNEEVPSRMFQTLRARDELLYNKQILSTLQEVDDSYLNSSFTGKTRPKIESYKDMTSYYAKTLADLAAMGLAGELLKSNDEKFDIRMLEYSLDKFKNIALQENIINDIKEINLRRDKRDCEDVWKIDHPQIICVINKEII